MDILNELQDIFRDVFDDESIELKNETSAKDIEDWDSLAQISLVVAIEKHFKIKLGINEIATLKDVGEMVETIKKHLEE